MLDAVLLVSVPTTYVRQALVLHGTCPTCTKPWSKYSSPPSKNNQTITDHYCILFQQLPPLMFQTPSPLRDTHKRQERPSSQLQLNQAPPSRPPREPVRGQGRRPCSLITMLSVSWDP